MQADRSGERPVNWANVLHATAVVPDFEPSRQNLAASTRPDFVKVMKTIYQSRHRETGAPRSQQIDATAPVGRHRFEPNGMVTLRPGFYGSK